MPPISIHGRRPGPRIYGGRWALSIYTGDMTCRSHSVWMYGIEPTLMSWIQSIANRSYGSDMALSGQQVVLSAGYELGCERLSATPARHSIVISSSTLPLHSTSRPVGLERMEYSIPHTDRSRSMAHPELSIWRPSILSGDSMLKSRLQRIPDIK